jgi:hypothetical protein
MTFAGEEGSSEERAVLAGEGVAGEVVRRRRGAGRDVFRAERAAASFDLPRQPIGEGRLHDRLPQPRQRASRILAIARLSEHVLYAVGQGRAARMPAIDRAGHAGP